MAEGLKIKEFIERVGIKSQNDLAERLDVTPQTVSKWIKGVQYPPHETEEKLLKMGMTVEELFGFPYPSSAKSRGAMWEVMENHLEMMLEDIRQHKS